MSDPEANQDTVENVSETNGQTYEAEDIGTKSTIAQILVGIPNETVRDLEAMEGQTDDESDEDDDFNDDSDESYDTGSLSGSYTDYNTSDDSEGEPEGAVGKLINQLGGIGFTKTVLV